LILIRRLAPGLGGADRCARMRRVAVRPIRLHPRQGDAYAFVMTYE
jgi:hypothetical protein